MPAKAAPVPARSSAAPSTNAFRKFFLWDCAVRSWLRRWNALESPSNVKTTFDIAEAQARLPKLVRAKQTLSLRQDNETVAFLVPRARMEALLETMEILANPQAVRAIRRDQSGRGKYLPLSVRSAAVAR